MIKSKTEISKQKQKLKAGTATKRANMLKQISREQCF